MARLRAVGHRTVYNVSPTLDSDDEASRQLQLETMGSTISKIVQSVVKAPAVNEQEDGGSKESQSDEDEGEEDGKLVVEEELEAAVKSANLLNAARQSARQGPSNVVESTQTAPEETRTDAIVTRGKLKRPTFMAQNLNRVAKAKTRKDPYDITLSSPEKKKEPVRATGRKKAYDISPEVPPQSSKAVSKQGRAALASIRLAEPVGKREGLRSTRAVSADSEPRSEPTTPRQSSRLHGQAVDLSHIDYNKIPGSKYPVKRKSASLGEDLGSTSPRPSKKQKSPLPNLEKNVEVRVPVSELEEIQNEEIISELEEMKDQEPVSDLEEHQNYDSSGVHYMQDEDSEDDANENGEVLETTESPDEQPEGDDDEEPEPEPQRSRRINNTEKIPNRKRPATRSMRSVNASERDLPHSKPIPTDQIQVTKDATVPQKRRSGRPQKGTDGGSATKPPEDLQTIVVRQHAPVESQENSSRALVRTAKSLSTRRAQESLSEVRDDDYDYDDAGNESDYETDEQIDIEASDSESGSDAEGTMPGAPLDRIRHFIKTGRISGKCQTKEGDTIWRACRSARQLFELNNISVKDVNETLEGLYKMLDAYTSTDKKSLMVMRKRDAFAYLFRSLGQVIMALHDCTPTAPISTSEEDLTRDTLHIATCFIQQILVFKECLSMWKIDAPKRKGVLVTRPALRGIISPLRELLDDYTRELHLIDRRRKANRSRQAHLEDEARHIEEERRKAEALKIRRERRKRWQDLHIERMKCEPNPEFHDHLRFRDIPDLEELDANGEKFERLAVFRARTSPPGNISDVEGLEWDDEEKIALLDGLREFAGRQHVYERIFRRHCGRDGILRPFNVTEITTQAAYLKHMIIKDDQMEGRETEDWVLNIPVLP